MRTKTLCTSQDIGYQWSLFLSKENVKLCLILSVKVRPVFQKRFPHLYKDFCNNFRRQRTHTVTNEHACLVEGGRWRVCYGGSSRQCWGGSWVEDRHGYCHSWYGGCRYGYHGGWGTDRHRCGAVDVGAFALVPVTSGQDNPWGCPQPCQSTGGWPRTQADYTIAEVQVIQPTALQ